MTALDDVLARIPYLRAHELAVDGTEDRVTVRLPVRPQLTNHVGILHAGALFTAAETAAGVAAWRVVDGDRAFVLLRSCEVRYTRRAEGEVRATATVAAADSRPALEAFEATGRADVSVRVTATDATTAVVLEASFDYALRPRRSDP